ncbi:MAG TPA: NBR1-Ig-like domain-containing protein, partial [Anaerolineales bacterium]|nr:NBR1-Ig-like domain-containing protein [Anaerolineales bacterium]
MFKKLSMVTLLMALMLSACGGQQVPTETAEPVPTETRAAVVTEAPTIEIPVTGPTETLESVTATPDVPPTPSIPRPENEPGCTNSASFVSDITIPDNSVIDAGETFTKTWRISNTGTCIWAWDYVLTHYSDARMGAPDSVPLDITYPGQTLDISVELTAPDSPGTYRGNFVIENPEGLIMKVDEDSRLWLIINVTNTAAPTATATAGSGVSPASTSGSDSGTASCSFATDRTKLTEVINALNAYRAQNGLPAYTVNSLLARAAQRHANDIACNNLFVHTGSDGSTPQSRVADTGYTGLSVTENVYGSYPPLNGQGVVNWWANDKTDPQHNK